MGTDDDIPTDEMYFDQLADLFLTDCANERRAEFTPAMPSAANLVAKQNPDPDG